MSEKQGGNAKSGGDLRDDLLSAAEEGDDQHVTKLCADISELRQDKDIYSAALYVAARSGHTKVVEILVHSGADVDYRKIAFNTPLYAAAEEGYTDTVKVLLSSGANITQVSRLTGEDALTAAARRGHIQTVRALLEAGACINASASHARKDALVVASSMGHTEIVKLLLTKGANKTDEALYHAIKNDNLNPEMAELLLQFGANVNCKVKGELPLMYAARLGHTKIAEVFLRYGASVNPSDDISETSVLMVAVYYAHIETSRLLLKSGANVNHSISSWSHVLFGVLKYTDASLQSLRIMKELLLYGANIRKAHLTDLYHRDDLVINPLHIAMKAVEKTNHKKTLSDYIMLLYAAGAFCVGRLLLYSTGGNRRYRRMIQNLLRENPNPLPSNELLFDLCRVQIRAHLLSPTGGNQKNLIQAVSKLPLPEPLKKSLLLDINILWMHGCA